MLVLTLLLLNAAPSIDESAHIELEQAEAQRAIDAKYGHKKPSELTAAETRAKIHDQAEADAQVLEKHGTNAKEWSRNALKKQRGEYAEEQRDVKALAAKRKEAATAASAQADLPPPEVKIERGEQPPTDPDTDKAEAAEIDGLDAPLTDKNRPGKAPPAISAPKKVGKTKAPPVEKKKKKKKSTE